MLQALADRLFKGVDALLAALLLAMVLMVFGNVVLRYGFNSGIAVSEELSRFCFVWLTFLGAIAAMRDNAHLGMDNLVGKLSRRGKLVCLAASQCLILLSCAMLAWGTWRQHEVNATNMAPVTGLSMIWVFGVGYVTALAIGAQSLIKLARIAGGRIDDAELVAVVETAEHLPPAAGPAGGARA
jgi:TRAP-type C4-dicarboxylate transport system permease small subunit